VDKWDRSIPLWAGTTAKTPNYKAADLARLLP